MKSQIKFVAGVFMISCLGALAGVAINDFYKQNEQQSQLRLEQPVRLANYSSTPPIGADFTKAASMTVNGVVHVKTTYVAETFNKGQSYDPFRDFFYGDRGIRQPQASSGSGVIISEDGYIVTNNHVIQNGQDISVVLNDNRSYKAKVVGTDPSTDLALLKISEKDLPYVIYGNSDELLVGEWVLAVGNPFNLTSTVTAGIVSAKARNINILPDQFAIESFIQTDAAVNPGNSGGALVNTNGELVGINSAIASNTGSFTGYSFAVPVNIVKKVIGDLLEYGTVQRAFIGVSIRDVDSQLADELKLKKVKGVYVSGLTQGGAAEGSGIKIGDVIISVSGVDVNNSPQLQEQVGRHRPGDDIEVIVLRDGKEKIVNVVLRNKDGNTGIVKNVSVNMLGASFETLSKEEKSKLGLEYGVKVLKLEAGKLRSAGIKEGFIITSIDKKEIRNSDEVAKLLENKKGGILIEGVYPNGTRAYYGFGI